MFSMAGIVQESRHYQWLMILVFAAGTGIVFIAMPSLVTRIAHKAGYAKTAGLYGMGALVSATAAIWMFIRLFELGQA